MSLGTRHLRLALLLSVAACALCGCAGARPETGVVTPPPSIEATASTVEEPVATAKRVFGDDLTDFRLAIGPVNVQRDLGLELRRPLSDERAMYQVLYAFALTAPRGATGFVNVNVIFPVEGGIGRRFTYSWDPAGRTLSRGTGYSPRPALEDETADYSDGYVSVDGTPTLAKWASGELPYPEFPIPPPPQ